MSRWTEKPVLGSSINWNHPLSKGLDACWLFNEGAGIPKNIANKKVQFSSIVSTWGNSRWGKGKIYSNSATGDLISGGGQGNFLLSPTNSIGTFLFLFDKGDKSINNNSQLFTTSTLDYFRFTLNFETYNNDNFGFTKIGVADLPSTISPPEFKKSFSVFTIHQDQHFECFVNGQYYIDTNTSNFLTNSTSFADGVFGANFTGCINTIYKWKRILSLNEIKELYLAPYQFIYKPRRVFYSIPISVGTWGHKIYGINNANIGKVNQIDKSNINKVNNA